MTRDTRLVSFDIVLQRFESKLPAPINLSEVCALLDAAIEDVEDGFLRLTTSDGGADVYGLGDASRSLMINHMSGNAVWTILFDIAFNAQLVAMPVGGGTVHTEATVYGDLPSKTPPPVVLVHSASELRQALLDPENG